VISGEVKEVAEKAAGLGCFFSRTLVNRVLALTTMTISRTAVAKFGSVSKSEAFVTLGGERILGETSKRTLKIDNDLGILVEINLISTMQVRITVC
jgi:hypothetical protein